MDKKKKKRRIILGIVFAVFILILYIFREYIMYELYRYVIPPPDHDCFPDNMIPGN